MEIEKTETETESTERPIVDPALWVSKYADYLYSYVITRISDEEQARDLVQETFLAALERVDKFEGRSSEKTWLTAILKNKIIDVYRKKASGLNRKTEPLKLEDETEFFETEDGHWKEQHQPQVFGLDVFNPLNAKEFENVLKGCMHQLPSLWMAIFSMKHMDDAETETICTELKVTPSNYWVIIHRTKVNLRACLQKNWI